MLPTKSVNFARYDEKFETKKPIFNIKDGMSCQIRIPRKNIIIVYAVKTDNALTLTEFTV